MYRNSEGNGDGNYHNSGKKRSNDGGDYGTPQKKSAFLNDPEAVYLKFMVPQATAGSVIGKAGQNISELQKEYGVHIRMSKANDVFPGTDNRVAIMSGKVGSVLGSTMVIFKRMTSPSDLFPKNPRPKSISDKELSLIVPQATAGLIIGKGGSRVKSIQEESNCHINLTQKNEHLPTNERVVTIQNNENDHGNIEKALKLILEIIKGDPQSASCLTINYAAAGGARHSRDDYEDLYEEPKSYGGGAPRNWNRGSNVGGDNEGSGGQGLGGAIASGFSTASGYPPQVHFWCTFAGPPISNGHTPPTHMLEGMKAYLLNVGFPPKAIQEILTASNLLASYGILKPGNISVFNTPQIQMNNPFQHAMSGNESMGSIEGGWNNSMGMFMKQFQQGASNRSYDEGSFGSSGGYVSSGMGGMNAGLGLGGGYGKNDSANDMKRRF